MRAIASRGNSNASTTFDFPALFAPTSDRDVVMKLELELLEQPKVHGSQLSQKHRLRLKRALRRPRYDLLGGLVHDDNLAGSACDSRVVHDPRQDLHRGRSAGRRDGNGQRRSARTRPAQPAPLRQRQLEMRLESRGRQKRSASLRPVRARDRSRQQPTPEASSRSLPQPT